MKILKIAVLLLIVTCSIVSGAQTFQEAASAVARKDYETAFKGFKQLAEQGNATAQGVLAGMYYSGRPNLP